MEVGYLNPHSEGQPDLMYMIQNSMDKNTQFPEPPQSIPFYNATTAGDPLSSPPSLYVSDNYINPGGTTELSFCDPTQGQQRRASVAAMREMIFRMAAMQPVHIDPEAVKPPKRRNVRISKDPQSVAARHRRERISERIRILQRLVPGGTKMDTASMLDEAIHYVKFLKTQVQSLEQAAVGRPSAVGVGFPAVGLSGGGGGVGNYSCFGGRMYEPAEQGFMMNNTQMLS